MRHGILSPCPVRSGFLTGSMERTPVRGRLRPEFSLNLPSPDNTSLCAEVPTYESFVSASIRRTACRIRS